PSTARMKRCRRWTCLDGASEKSTWPLSSSFFLVLDQPADCRARVPVGGSHIFRSLTIPNTILPHQRIFERFSKTRPILERDVITTRSADRPRSTTADPEQLARSPPRLGRPGELARVLQHLLEIHLRRGNQVGLERFRSRGCRPGNRAVGC